MIYSALLIASVSRKAGGLFESVRRLGQSLVEEGVGVEVFSLKDKFTDYDICQWRPLRTHVCTPFRPYSFSYSPEFLRLMSREKFDITHCHGLWMYPSVAHMHYARHTRTPYVISPHGMLDPWAINNSYWKKVIAGRFYEKSHLQGAACLRALCESEAESMRAYGLRNPICIIPNGIDMVDSHVEIPPPWHGYVEKGEKVLFYVGRIHPKKGLVNLLHGWTLAGKEHRAIQREWHLVIAGWDQLGHEADLRRLVREMGIEKSVAFVGPQFGEDKQAAYNHADAFVLPSFSEGLPMVVLEAWANKLPVIMTPECNIPEGFKAEAAINVRTNSQSIKEGLIRICSMSDSERTSMGSRGHNLVKEKFTWPKIASDIHSVYEWVLGGGKPPAHARITL